MTVEPGETRALLSGMHVVICDGAMGTMLHSAGIALDQSLGELNLGRPALVRDIHRAYLGAGAQLLQTNTFDSNRLRLARAGLQNRVSEINIAGARLAREAVELTGTSAAVAGSVGPPTGAGLVPRISPAERSSAVREQIAALADWVDLIVLETFGDVETLASAAEIARGECDLPIVAQLTFGYDGRTLRGEEPEAAAAVLGRLDIAAIGANCTVGPAVLQDVVAALARGCDLPISVQPNAGSPRRRGGTLRYAHNVDYFATAAGQFVANGASIVGGCCGTTPAHIRAIANALAGRAPLPRPRSATPDPVRVRAVATAAEPIARNAWLGHQFAVIAGMRAPRDVDLAGFLEQAEQLVAAGVDQLAIIDPDPPAARVNPVAAAVLLQQRLGDRVILQVEAADRSLAGLQADLLGAHALGLHVVVCRAGAPYVAGAYPEADSPWDVDAARLVSTVAGLNEG
ncbi:MAG: homocysteine S-methyltransferase family protein, partial [Actinomycetota bacterium]|nr:homocysteine S-methyltransferase family protein [Actinomycetota bacterium]